MSLKTEANALCGTTSSSVESPPCAPSDELLISNLREDCSRSDTDKLLLIYFPVKCICILSRRIKVHVLTHLVFSQALILRTTQSDSDSLLL